MNRLWPSLWLLGAVLYAAATLLLTQPFLDRGSASLAATHETIVAKQPEPVSPKLPPVSPAELEATQTTNVSWPHNEWVEIVGYTAVVRADPSVSSRVLTAYPIGHALRVIERKGDFARIQDLSSGHLGWVAASSIAAFVPGYREREEPIAPRPLVAVAQSQPSALPPKASQSSHGAVPDTSEARDRGGDRARGGGAAPYAGEHSAAAFSGEPGRRRRRRSRAAGLQRLLRPGVTALFGWVYSSSCRRCDAPPVPMRQALAAPRGGVEALPNRTWQSDRGLPADR